MRRWPVALTQRAWKSRSRVLTFTRCQVVRSRVVYSIGDMAQLGGVTPRMLRHYDELGVFVPEHVDAANGYRRYAPHQLADLFRVLALKDLGLSLGDIKRIMTSDVGPAELRGMLVLRRTDLESELDEAATRLGRVEAQIERLERQMNQPSDRPEIEVTTKRLPAMHVAVASDVSASFASRDIGPVIQPLYPRLFGALAEAGVEPIGPPISYYDDAVEGGVGVHAAVSVADSVVEVPGLDVVELPEVELAATAIHEGDMAVVDAVTVPVVYDWIREQGLQTTGYVREVSLECPENIADWRTELQFPVAPAS